MQPSTRSEEVKQLLLAGPETPWQKYCELAARTESVPTCYYEKIAEGNACVRATRLLHAALGICTELVEYDDNDGTQRNIAEELGDTSWYLAIIHNEFNPLPLMDLVTADFEDKKPNTFWLGEIQDVVKRHIFYGELLDVPNKKGDIPIERLSIAYWCIHGALDKEAIKCNLLPIELLVANIVKLEKRYPDLCFNEDHAVKRDIENELSHIPGIPTFTNGDPTKFVSGSIGSESLLVGRAEFHLGNEAEKLENAEDIFEKGSGVILTGFHFNGLLKSILTMPNIEQLAMQVCFSVAEYYRGIGAVGIARGYDAMYREYSGKGDKLEDLSVFIMWRDLGYGLREDQIITKLRELGYEAA